MIGLDGKPLTRTALLAAIEIYNREPRGSTAYASLPRALITILDGLAPGKTGYLKGSDGKLQLIRGKDGKIIGK